MSTFVRIEKPLRDGECAVLNLDLVANAILTTSDQGSGQGHPSQAMLKCVSADGMTPANIWFQALDDARHWVLKHLGVEL